MSTQSSIPQSGGKLIKAAGAGAHPTWPDGTPRSTGNAFDWLPAAPILSPIEKQYLSAKEKSEKRKFSNRFKTLEAYENHLANARKWAKIRNDRAREQRNAINAKVQAMRVARKNVVISPTPQADSDRTKCIQGSSSAFRTTP